MWMDRHNNAVKTIVTSISSHLTRLKETLHIDLYSRIFGYCMQVLVTRIMLFLKTRSKIGSAFDGHEVKRLKKDVEGIKSFILDQVQFIDDRHTALVDDNQSSFQQTIDLLPFLSSTHLRHHQLLTHGTSSGKWLAQSSLQTLNIMSDLITEKYDTTEFYCACEHVVDKYSTVSAKKMKLHHNNIVTSRTDHQYISELLLLTVVVALRTDSKDKLMSYLRDVILHQRGEGSHRNSGSDQIDSSGNEINQYKHDIIVRLFGSIETYSINSSSSSNLINTTTQINITTNEISSSNNAFIPEQQQQQHSQHQHDLSKSEHSNHININHINFKHLISPVAAIGKHLREVASDTVKKASDNMANNLSKSRYNEEKAMLLMRTIGLEVSRASLYFIDQQHDHGDNIGAAPIDGNSSNNYITKQHKRPSSSSSSSTNLLSHRNSTSRNLLFDYEPVVAVVVVVADSTRSKSSVDHTCIDTKRDGHKDKETKEDKDTRDSRNGKDGRVNRQSTDHHQMHQQLLLLQHSLPCWKKGDHIPFVAVRTSNDMRTSRIIGGDNSIDREGKVGSMHAIVIDDIQVKGLQSSALFDGPNPYIYFTLR